MDPEVAWLRAHVPEPLETLLSLENNSSLKEEKHPKLHQTKVPVVIKEPETRSEELEDKEGRNHVLLVDLDEFRNWHFHSVGAPNQISLLDLS